MAVEIAPQQVILKAEEATPRQPVHPARQRLIREHRGRVIGGAKERRTVGDGAIGDPPGLGDGSPGELDAGSDDHVGARRRPGQRLELLSQDLLKQPLRQLRRDHGSAAERIGVLREEAVDVGPQGPELEPPLFHQAAQIGRGAHHRLVSALDQASRQAHHGLHVSSRALCRQRESHGSPPSRWPFLHIDRSRRGL